MIDNREITMNGNGMLTVLAGRLRHLAGSHSDERCLIHVTKISTVLHKVTYCPCVALGRNSWMCLRTDCKASILFKLVNEKCVHFLQSIYYFNNLRSTWAAKMSPVHKGTGVV